MLFTDDGKPDLKPNEIEVLRLVANGLTNREIAEALRRSEKTIEKMLGNEDPYRAIYPKIGARNRAQAVAWYLKTYNNQNNLEISHDQILVSVEPTLRFDHFEDWLSHLQRRMHLQSQREEYATVWEKLRPEIEIAVQRQNSQIQKGKEIFRTVIHLWASLGDTARTLGLTWEAEKYYREVQEATLRYEDRFGHNEALRIVGAHVRLMQFSDFYMQIPALIRSKSRGSIRIVKEHIKALVRLSAEVPIEVRRDFASQNLWLLLREDALSSGSLKNKRKLVEAFREEAGTATHKSVEAGILCGLIRCATGMEGILIGVDRPPRDQHTSPEMKSIAREAYDALEDLLRSPEVSDLNRVRAYKSMAIFAFADKDVENVKALLEQARRLAGQRLFGHQLLEVQWLYQSLLP